MRINLIVEIQNDFAPRSSESDSAEMERRIRQMHMFNSKKTAAVPPPTPNTWKLFHKGAFEPNSK
jgi:hypothetical protein